MRKLIAILIAAFAIAANASTLTLTPGLSEPLGGDGALVEAAVLVSTNASATATVQAVYDLPVYGLADVVLTNETATLAWVTKQRRRHELFNDRHFELCCHDRLRAYDDKLLHDCDKQRRGVCAAPWRAGDCDEQGLDGHFDGRCHELAFLACGFGGLCRDERCQALPCARSAAAPDWRAGNNFLGVKPCGEF